MSFELLDNLFQVAALGCSALVGGGFALKYRSRRCLTLALAYACFSMGTLYYVLHLAILGATPRIFYVAELSWLASYLFCLSFQILRAQGTKPSFRRLPSACGLCVAAAILRLRIFGPSYFVSALFALTAGALAYLSAFRLRAGGKGRGIDALLLLCLCLQVALYVVSGFTGSYSRFNPYFAVDILLTLCLMGLLPLCVREVRAQ